MAFLTIFTTPKPFTNPHICTIQRNAIRSWQQLGDDVAVLMIGDEEGMSENAELLGVKQISEVKKNAYGTPYIRSLFDIARKTFDSPVMAYINADILVFSDFVQACRNILRKKEQFLGIGQRWDLNIAEEIEYTDAWEVRVLKQCNMEGRLHPRGGSDYFIFPRTCYIDIPDLVVGRAGWDNWMIYEARKKGWATIDTSPSIQIIHQDHDYSHLPNNQPHYRLPESLENTRLAGGDKAIFTLLDTDCQLIGADIKPVTFSWEKYWREFEIFPLITLKSERLWKLAHYLIHPTILLRRVKNRIIRKHSSN